MRILLFGATGMVGQGVLRECLKAPDVDLIQIVGRTAVGLEDPKVREIVRQDLSDLGDVEADLRDFDACLYCLGVSSAGMSEQQYSRLTFDLTLSVARTLSRLNNRMVFIYVSGAGTDNTERGRTMWARVKGRTENALRGVTFRALYLFRPGIIQPLNGERSKTRAYRLLYQWGAPLLPLLRRVAPDRISTTESLGQAMLAAVRNGAKKTILEAADINTLARVAHTRHPVQVPHLVA
jgi:uncharacterized protein YbjT (DUF2867 family)